MCCAYDKCKHEFIGDSWDRTKYGSKHCCSCLGCCWKWKARVIWFPVITVGLLILFILLYFPGYKDHNKFNENAVETECTILDHIVRGSGYSYAETCDCKQICNSMTVVFI